MKKSKLVLLLGGIGVLGLGLFAFAGWLYYQNYHALPQIEAVEDNSAIPRDAVIWVDGNGLYQISKSHLHLIGFQPNQSPKWRLTYRGVEIPYWYTNNYDSAGILFYAPPTQNEYVQGAYYFFSQKNSPNISDSATLHTTLKIWDISSLLPKIPSPTSDAVIIPTTLGNNLVYQPLADADAWFWYRIVAPGEKEIPFEVDTTIFGDSIIRVNLWANTSSSVSPNHHYQIKLNEKIIAEETWDGQGDHVIEAIVPANAFKKGKNVITLHGILHPQIAVDIVYLDTIEIYTWQKPQLRDDKQLVFGASSPSTLFALTFLTKADWLMDITSPLSPTLVKKGTDQTTLGQIFLATKSKAIREVNRIEPITLYASDYPTAHQTAQFLVIGPQDLLDPLQPWLEKRRQEGLDVETQDVAAIYPQYGGYAEPQAIRRYLQDLRKGYAQLKYVMLVGDASSDPQGFVDDASLNRLPTFFIHSLFGGRTSSELPFAMINNDTLDFLTQSNQFDLSLAVGRLPARSPEQVANWVKKMLIYESNAPSTAPWKVVAIADPQGDMFAPEAQSFLDLWHQPVNTELYTPVAGSSEAATKIAGYFKSKTTLISYFGHGSIEMWGKDQLFTHNEATQLTNPTSFPLVVQMTCLTGYYIHPQIESISEALLWNPNGGTVIMIAPSSLTLPNDQEFFIKSLVNHLQVANHARIGDVWLKTIENIEINNQGIRDVLATFSLFGDPTLVIR